MDSVCAILVAHMIQTNAPPDEQTKDEKVFHGGEDTTSLETRQFRRPLGGQNATVLVPLLQTAGVDDVMNHFQCPTRHVDLTRHSYLSSPTFSLAPVTQQSGTRMLTNVHHTKDLVPVFSLATQCREKIEGHQNMAINHFTVLLYIVVMSHHTYSNVMCSKV